MDVFTTLGEVPADFGPSAITFGKFDGVHRGHKQVIDHLHAEARADSLTTTVVTFDRNPLSVLAPQACPAELVSNAQKLVLLEELGVDATVILEFNRAFSENSPREFVEGMLVNTLHAKVVLVGVDVRFGHRGAGNVTVLQEMGDELGFRVELLQNFELPDHFDVPDAPTHEPRRVSSTWVREMLGGGDVRSAGELLGRYPVVRSSVVPGVQRGRKLGYPTVTLSPDVEGFIPADGVYAAWVLVDGRRFRAGVSIGNNPTFDDVGERQVEANLLGDGDESININLDGKTIEVHFVERLRSMRRFDDHDALIMEMAHDFERVRALLSGGHSTSG
ncbi:MAG: riboflavin biosynthesis protein RibF [Microbacteriaceae bacterium]|nr:riboflavin biosynthesis protein RibF [Microbacteriaceae bacterium]